MSRLPTVAESREALHQGSIIGPDRIRRDATLRVVCTGCNNGLTIVAITYVTGRALVATREKDDLGARDRRIGWHWQFSWLDRGSVIRARCKSRWHVLNADDLRAVMPGPGAGRAKPVRVAHPAPGSAV